MKIVIIGAGEVGYHLAERLSRESKEVVVIDINPEAVQRLSDDIDVQAVLGSGSDPAMLEAVGLSEAEILLAVTNSDEVNLVACMLADLISPAIRKIARVRNSNHDAYHDRFCEHPPRIDRIINPDVEVVNTILQFVQVPGAVDIGEFADGRVKLVGVRLPAESPLSGVRLQDLSNRSAKTPPLIAAIVRNESFIIPVGQDALMPNDLVYFVSEAGNATEFLALFGKTPDPVKHALLVGGGSIGLRLAKELEALNISIKLMDKNADRCKKLAEELDRTVVLHGDGRDQTLLQEENVGEIDLVATLTDEEETNVLISLLAKRLGAGKTITKISKFSYFPLMETIGLKQVVSPRLSAINSILTSIRRGKILNAVTLQGEQAEVLEVVALDTSDIVGHPLKNIKFPKGCLLVSIIRGDDIIIPNGASVVLPDDHIILFARREAVSDIEKLLAVKLEYL